MSSVELNHTQTGFVVRGDICFSNVLRLRRQGDRLIQDRVSSDIEIDLSHVDSSDTSGLSLLLRWLHFAKKNGKKVSYASIPESLLKVARVCGISDLIG